jgi:hypothetical protein
MQTYCTNTYSGYSTTVIVRHWFRTTVIGLQREIFIQNYVNSQRNFKACVVYCSIKPFEIILKIKARNNQNYNENQYSIAISFNLIWSHFHYSTTEIFVDRYQLWQKTTILRNTTAGSDSDSPACLSVCLSNEIGKEHTEPSKTFCTINSHAPVFNYYSSDHNVMSMIPVKYFSTDSLRSVG